MPRRFGTGFVDPSASETAGPAASMLGRESAPSDEKQSPNLGFGSTPSAAEQPPPAPQPDPFEGASAFGTAVPAGPAPADLSADPGRDGLAPQLGLPKGGGAIRGIGESFDFNAFTGTGSLSIPVYASPGRGAPSLTLNYDSGAGNGPFGLGFRLSPPSITRRTDRGLPRYLDDAESDTFMLAGAEHLVPLYRQQGDDWVREERPAQVDGESFHVLAYRPRVESTFARIEHWVSTADQTSFWRVTDGSNVVSTFGRNARIADPDDPRRIFTWLLDRVEDDRGHITLFEYLPEDAEGVDTDAPWERERRHTDMPQRYLKRIRYGNRAPGIAGDWMFEVLLDYGEHGPAPPDTHVEEHTVGLSIPVEATQPWPARMDAFSNFRAGFEMRTHRLCRRILMVHRIPDLNGGAPTVVASTDLAYEEDPVAFRLTSVTRRGYVLEDPAGDVYTAQAVPPLDLAYQPAALGDTLVEVDAESLADLGGGLDADHLQLVDLDGEGIPGLLHTAPQAWRYKRGSGDGRFAGAQTLSRAPSAASVAPRLMDLDGDGHLSLTNFGTAAPGSQERTEDGDWGRKRPWLRIPNVPVSDPRSRFVDLNGDGFADLLEDRGGVLAWYPSLARDGFDEPVIVPKPSDDIEAPQRLYSDPRVALFFADMTGDGLADLVCVRNGAVSYRPNLGFGRFGPRIDMAGLTPFDHLGLFHPARVRLGDIDGSGTSDLVYFDAEGARVWINAAGNRYLARGRIEAFPPTDTVTHADLADVTGTGTADLVWSSSLPADRGRHIRFVELLPAGKPYLLTEVRNNMGRTTRVRYAPSTRFYLEDRVSGHPWKTRLPFPVHVIERVEVFDDITRQRFVSTYRYRHGYFDGAEREFRGFALVEQRDTESFAHFAEPGLFPTGHNVQEERLHVPPVVTRTWFHTGAYLGLTSASRWLADDYWAGDPHARDLDDSVLPQGLTAAEIREGLRALRGRALRQEIFAEDGSEVAQDPYVVKETNFTLRLLQPKQVARHAVFLVHGRETLNYHYERDPDDPRLQQQIVLDVDAFGVVTRSATVAYPRRNPEIPEQGQTAIVVTEVDVQHQDNQADRYRLATPIEQRAFELHGLAADPLDPLSIGQLRTALDGNDNSDAAPVVDFETHPAGRALRRLSRRRALYYRDDLSGPLLLGQAGLRALVFETRAQAFTAAHATAVWQGAADDEDVADILTEGGYAAEDGAWWVHSGRLILDPTRFFLPTTALDPFGNQTAIDYDAHNLFVESVTDPVNNTVRIIPDYRVLAPRHLTDPNGNLSAVQFDPLGQVVRLAVIGNPDLAEGDSLDDPTAVLDYDLFAFLRDGAPGFSRSRVRERHRDPTARRLERIVYSDGSGKPVQEVAGAEPGPAPLRDTQGALVLDDNGDVTLVDAAERWVASGRTVLNNKGLPIKQFEPFFNDRPDFETEEVLVHWGVTPLIHYDPLGRRLRVDLPDGTLERVRFTPWEMEAFDANDTVLESQWHSERSILPPNNPERRAAQLTEAHADTPTRTLMDHQGRAVHTIEGNGALTRAELDVLGKPIRIVDASDNTAEEREHGMLGQAIEVRSVDAGSRLSVTDVMGAPLREWNSRGFRKRARFDAARRPTHIFVRDADGEELLMQRMLYGEALPATDAEAARLRGRLFRIYDGAGVLTHLAHDLNGNLIRQTRLLTGNVDATPNWTLLADLDNPEEVETAAAPLLEVGPPYETRGTFDAIGRPVTQTTPDNSEVAFGYNDAGLLETVRARLHGADVETPFVDNIDYNARGQRILVVLGNGTETRYEYDDLTFRLRRLETRDTGSGRLFQDLGYTYDPVGNIAEIRDGAQQTIYYANQVVEPVQRFVYDAVYRLTEATGREHRSLDQLTDIDFSPLAHPADGQAMRTYTDHYAYDLVGNIMEHRHVADQGSWTRAYEYAANGNRLLFTSGPNDPPGTRSQPYEYDDHGNMVLMPHLPEIRFDHADQMQAADRQGGGEVFFQYDAGGQRVRKLARNQSGALIRERIYIGAFEVFREIRNGDMRLVRETLHIGDNAGRVCLVETLTTEDGAALSQPVAVHRYQYGNHLGSVGLELTQHAEIISYEEYHPYGTTAFRSASGNVDVSPSRYQYTGKERDEETGLYYFGARYYVVWLGRWSSADPAGITSRTNLYQYSANNPIIMLDPDGLEEGVADKVVGWGKFFIGQTAAYVETAAHAGEAAAEMSKPWGPLKMAVTAGANVVSTAVESYERHREDAGPIEAAVLANLETNAAYNPVNRAIEEGIRSYNAEQEGDLYKAGYHSGNMKVAAFEAASIIRGLASSEMLAGAKSPKGGAPKPNTPSANQATKAARGQKAGTSPPTESPASQQGASTSTKWMTPLKARDLAYEIYKNSSLLQKLHKISNDFSKGSISASKFRTEMLDAVKKFEQETGYKLKWVPEGSIDKFGRNTATLNELEMTLEVEKQLMKLENVEEFYKQVGHEIGAGKIMQELEIVKDAIPQTALGRFLTHMLDDTVRYGGRLPP